MVDTDVRNMTQVMRAALLNAELIQLHQVPFNVQHTTSNNAYMMFCFWPDCIHGTMLCGLAILFPVYTASCVLSNIYAFTRCKMVYAVRLPD